METVRELTSYLKRNNIQFNVDIDPVRTGRIDIYRGDLQITLLFSDWDATKVVFRERRNGLTMSVIDKLSISDLASQEGWD